MVGCYQNEGVNLFVVVPVDSASVNSYETDMLYNNFIEGLIQPEFRALNGEMFLYSKINGMKSLRGLMDEGVLTMEQTISLIRSLCNVVMETGEYMLNADNILIDTETIFYSYTDKVYRYIYVPGKSGNVRDNMKRVVEDIIKKIDHSNTGLIDFMYEVYDRVVVANFDVEMLCGYVEDRWRDLNKRNHSDTDCGSAYKVENCEKSTTRDDNDGLMDMLFGDDPQCLDRSKMLLASVDTASVQHAHTDRLIPVIIAITVLAGLVVTGGQMLRAGTITDVRVIMVMVTAVCIELFIYIELRKKVRQESGSSGHKEGDFGRGREGPGEKREGFGEKREGSGEKREGSGETREGFREKREGFVQKGESLFCESQGDLETNKRETDEDLEQTTLLVCDSCGCAGRTYRKNIRLVRGLWEKSAYLGPNGIVIGRYPQVCDIVIDDISVSRQHIKIYEKEDGIYAEDIGSTNGTILNGERICKGEMYKIYDGDVVRIGGQEYHIQILLI